VNLRLCARATTYDDAGIPGKSHQKVARIAHSAWNNN
jgi:hypothetical protein